MKRFIPHVAAALAVLAITTAAGAQPAKAPFPYVWGKAHHVLPETHNNESGYFSLCERRTARSTSAPRSTASTPTW